MIEGYAYELEPLVPRPTAEPEPEIAETGAETEAADEVAAAAPVEMLETAGVAEPAEAPRAAE